MTLLQWFFVIIVLYYSLVLGIALKMHSKGLKGSQLFIAFIYPFLSMYAIVRLIMDKMKSDETLFTKLMDSLKAIQISISYYPVLVGAFSVYLLKQINTEKRKKHRPKKPVLLAVNIFRTFNRSYDEYDTRLYRHA